MSFKKQLVHSFFIDRDKPLREALKHIYSDFNYILPQGSILNVSVEYLNEPKEMETCGFCDKPCGNEWCVTNDKKDK